MKTHQGTAVFPGIAVAKAFWLGFSQSTPEREVTFLGEEVELRRLNDGVEKTRIQLEKIQQKALEKIGAKEAQIFEAHQMMLLDPEYLDTIKGEISDSKKPAVTAIRETTESFVQILSQSSSPYLRERVLDLKDVSLRLIRNLDQRVTEVGSGAPRILVGEDLLPSDLMAAAEFPILGVALQKGGLTSHTAILLKSMGIPTIFGLSSLSVDEAKKTQELTVVLDAHTGRLLTQPDSSTRDEFEKRALNETEEKKSLTVWKAKPTVMACGTKLPLMANVGNQVQLDAAVENGAEGVGLYRTEFLFMDRPKPPTEDEQFQIYKKGLESLKGRPLVIRTLDVGGDKMIPYLPMEKEENPFLGVRGLRLCLAKPEIFLTQIRALIRASEMGPIDVMFPMVTLPEELNEAFHLIEPLMKGKSARLRWGMMLEIPSNIFMIPEFSEKIDFFSVGTNDLTQYLTACDRMNPHLQTLSDPCSPGLLRPLAQLATQTKKVGRELSICGEAASDQLLIPFLVGIGVNKLSLNSLLVAQSRRLLSRLRKSNCESLARRVLTLPSAQKVREELQRFQSEI